MVVLALVCVVSLAVASGAQAYLYWTNVGGSIGRANLDGTGARGLIGGASHPIAVATDGTHIYWANEGSNTIGRANWDGSGVNQSFITGAGYPRGVAVDGGHIYWANYQSIGRANLDGTGVNQSFIGVPNNYFPTGGVAVDGGHIYWSDSDSGTIGRANLDGSDVTQWFIGGADGPGGIAVDGTHIYWANEGEATPGRTIGRANLDGTGVNQSFIAGAGWPSGVAVTPEHVYWTNYGSDTIGRANLDGTGVNQSFMRPGSAPAGIAVSPGYSPTAMRWDCLSNAVPVGSSTGLCTVTVADQGANPVTPSGVVTVGTTGGSFTATSCNLTPGSWADVTGLPASCNVFWSPPASALAGDRYTLTANYIGDLSHAANSASREILMIPPWNPVPTAPRLLTNVTQSATSWREGSTRSRMARTRPPLGTTFGFTLRRPARVWFVFTYRTIGRRVGGRCLPRANASQGGARCLRTVRAAFSRQAAAGRTRLHFHGRIDRTQKLPLGRYKLIVVATAKRQWSRPAILRFTILR